MIKHGKRYLVRLIKELRFIAPLLLGLIFLVNLTINKDGFWEAKEQILVGGNSQAKSYVTLKLLENNQLSEAKQISGEGAVREEEQQPGKIQGNIVGWQEVTNNLPGYRDADIKLAILNWKIYRVFDAKRYLESALRIDPNNELARRLAALVQ